VPFDCPLRVEDESRFKWELQSLSDYDLSRISADVWVKHNFGPRYVYTSNHKAEEIEYLLTHLRQNKCVMIAKSTDLSYKPWTLFGFWANRGGGFDMQLHPFKKKEEEEFLTDSMADEAVAQQAPLKITSISWRHTDSALQKDSLDIAHSGDTIELQAQFENYVEGAGVDFFVYGNVNGTKKQLTKVHTRCENMAATAEWVVDISKCDAESPGIEFDCEARSKKSSRKPIQIEEDETGGISLLFVAPNGTTFQDVNVRILAGGDLLVEDIAADGLYELCGIPCEELCVEYELEGTSYLKQIRWNAGNGPYAPEEIKQQNTDVEDR
jgi:hypothetical protein